MGVHIKSNKISAQAKTSNAAHLYNSSIHRALKCRCRSVILSKDTRPKFICVVVEFECCTVIDTLDTLGPERKQKYVPICFTQKMNTTCKFLKTFVGKRQQECYGHSHKVEQNLSIDKDLLTNTIDNTLKYRRSSGIISSGIFG